MAVNIQAVSPELTSSANTDGAKPINANTTSNCVIKPPSLRIKSFRKKGFRISLGKKGSRIFRIIVSTSIPSDLFLIHVGQDKSKDDARSTRISADAGLLWG